MTKFTLSEADVQELESADLDDLYADLAIAEAGTESNLGAARESLASIRAIASADSAIGEASLDGLVGIGKRIFNRTWPTVKAIVCKIYSENGGETPLKGWLAAAAAAVAAALGLAGPIAVLVVTIAIKLGLDSLCAADAAGQPA